MVELRRVDRPGRHPVWAEVYPERCPGCGQPYRGGHIAIGWLACACENVGGLGGGHRTLFCRDCRCEVFLPPHVAEHDQPART